MSTAIAEQPRERNLFERLRERIFTRRRENELEIVRDYRGMVIAIAQSELGRIKPANIDERADAVIIDNLALILDASGRSEADLKSDVQRYKQRLHWSELAQQEQPRKAAAESAHSAWQQADEAEVRRHREAMKKVAELETASRIAQTAYLECVGTDGNLTSTAATDDDERDLIAQLKPINERITRLKEQLHPRMLPRDAGLTPMMHTNCGALLEQIKRELTEVQARRTAGNVNEIKERLAAVEKFVAERRQELAAAEKEHANITRQLQITTDKLLPENFALTSSAPKPEPRQDRRNPTPHPRDTH